MVYSAIYLGGFVGVLLSGAFVYWEIGKFAEPQVPRTLFDERKEMFAYTAGLFVGVPIAFAFLLFLSSMTAGFVLTGLVEAAAVVLGIEVAQGLLLRSAYFGSGRAGPFYALGFRAGIGGILILAAVAGVLGGSAVGALAVAAVLVESVALLQLEVAGALLSIRAAPGSQRIGGGVVSGALVSGVALYFLGLGDYLGEVPGLIASAIVAAGMSWVYLRLRDPILKRVRPPTDAPGEEPETRSGSPFGRTDQ